VVERTLSWIARFRRLVVRYERRDDIHLAFLVLACAAICFRFLQSLLQNRVLSRWTGCQGSFDERAEP
jgi:hypothetical protein